MTRPLRRSVGFAYAFLATLWLGCHAIVRAEPPVASAVPAPIFSDLSDLVKKEIAMQIVCSAENSSLDWRSHYTYVQDIHDGRGYTAGIIGFCSGTGDMRHVIQDYTKRAPNNRLAKYLPALRKLRGSDSHDGLDPDFVADWHAAAADPLFQAAQDRERDEEYFAPAVRQAKADGLRALGQFCYYDAAVMHGRGPSETSLDGIRAAALKVAKSPARGGDETAYLNAFLDARIVAMKTEAAHEETTRVDTAQRAFLQAGNLDLSLPLRWKVYGESFQIDHIDLPKPTEAAFPSPALPPLRSPSPPSLGAQLK